MTALNELCRKFFFWLAERQPVHIVVFAFCLVVFYTILALIINPVYTRDASEYVALVEAFRQGAYDRAFPKHLPVLYTVFAGVVAKCGILDAVRSLVLISGFATALAVFPLFGILKKFAAPQLAALGALLFILFPKVIDCGVSPLLDSGRFLFFLTALWLIFSETKEFKCFRLLFLGIIYACLALVRAEGILWIFVLMLIHAVFVWHETKEKTLSSRALRLFAVIFLPLFVCSVFVSPRLIQMYHLTGYPVVDSRQSNAWKGFTRDFTDQKLARDVVRSLQTSGAVQKKMQKIVSYENDGGSGAISSDISRILRQPRFYKNFVQSFFYLYLPFTVLGLLCYAYQKKFTFKLKILLLLILLYNLLYFLLRAAAGRYLLLNVCLAMPFTLFGVEVVWNNLNKYFSQAYLLLIPIGIGGIFICCYSMKHMDEKPYECFKTASKYFSNFSKRNLKVARPVVLLVGADRGLGYYSDVNVIWYSKLGLNQRQRISDIAEQGVETIYAQYWTRKEMPSRVHVDYVVVDNKNCRQELDECRKLFHESYDEGRLTVFPVF